MDWTLPARVDDLEADVLALAVVVCGDHDPVGAACLVFYGVKDWPVAVADQVPQRTIE